MTEEINELRVEFNDELLNLVHHIGKLAPKSLVANNIDLVEDTIKKYPSKVIDQFVIHVLKYKENVDNYDEDFFMNNEFSEATGNDNIVEKIFQFKGLWKNITDVDKAGIFGLMQTLCAIAQEYFVVSNS